MWHGSQLILLERRMPQTRFVGIDISSEMCGYARDQVARHSRSDRIEIFEGELSDYLGQRVQEGGARSGPEADVVIFSYSLSMIPEWWGTLQQAIHALRNGGRIVIADFGRCQSWPAIARWRLYKNLSYFHVCPRADLADRLATIDGIKVDDESYSAAMRRDRRHVAARIEPVSHACTKQAWRHYPTQSTKLMFADGAA